MSEIKLIKELFEAAQKHNQKRVTTILGKLPPKWPIKAIGWEVNMPEVEGRETPVSIAVKNLDKKGAKIAEEIALDSYKKAVYSDVPIHYGVVSTVLTLVKAGKYLDIARRLFVLALKNGLGDHKFGTDSLCRSFYDYRKTRSYTVAFIYYSLFTEIGFFRGLDFLYDTACKTPKVALAYFISAWTKIGSGIGPAEFARIMDTYWCKNVQRCRELRTSIIRASMLAGYDFNTKYITEYNNFPLWTRLLQGKVNQQFLVELILDGRINLETPEIDKIKEPEIVKSIKSRRYVEKIPVLKLCKAKNLDAEELNARLNVISEVVYQLQLSDYIGKDGEVNINDSDFGKICDCISNILKAQKEGIFPYHLLSNRNEECHNKDTLAINSLEQISPKQLVTVIDQKQWVNEDGKKVHPKYCFDRGDIKGLLSTGINPYTNIVISEVFLNRIYNGYQVLPRAMELREAIEEIIEFDNLLPPKYPSDFDQVFERFRATLSKVNPYLDYQKWATEYTVEQYNIPIPELGSGQPMVHLWHTTGYNPEGVSFVDKFQIKIPLTLPREKYVTILMAMCNNKMEDKHNQVLYVVNAVRAMLDNLEPYKVIEKPSVGLEELKERKAELLKEFLTGGMKDRALMGEIQKIRGQIAELED